MSINYDISIEKKDKFIRIHYITEKSIKFIIQQNNVNVIQDDKTYFMDIELDSELLNKLIGTYLYNDLKVLSL